jgi:penicillin-binding protein 2
MNRDQDRQKLFNRRMAMLAGGNALMLSMLAGRLYFLQVIEADKYKTLADENRINLKLLPPPRGYIVDRRGVPVAVNRQNYRVLVVREEAGDVEATLDRLSRVVDVGDGEKRRVLKEMRRKRGFVPVTVRENLNWDEVARIEVHSPDLPGVSIDEGQSRHYPYQESLAHILGYVAAVSEKEQTGDPLLELPGFRIGKAGIEKIYDLALRGTGGNSQVEVNAFGRVIRELSRTDGQPGAEVSLTIDMELQDMISRRLAGESAAAVVMDVHRGDVLAMVSTPSFDPNAFNKGLSVGDWRALTSNPMAPLSNKAVAGQYAPGSTYKMIVALAALERGVISPGTKVFCSGSVDLGNATFHCWKKHGHGLMDLKQAIAQSCDVYFYEIAKRTGIDNISAMARRFGIGGRLGIDIPGEKPGMAPTRDWKFATIGVPWQVGETLIAGIGQGFVLTTPLQLAVMTARLVNGGYGVTPHLTRDVVTENGIVPRNEAAFKSIGVSAGNLDFVRRAMSAVVNSETGTARASRIDDKDFKMGGKTGTAQVRRISKAEREQGVIKNAQLPWEERDHALFVGFAPADNPRYAVSVVIEHGGGGSSVAAPIARDILTEVRRLGIGTGPTIAVEAKAPDDRGPEG